MIQVVNTDTNEPIEPETYKAERKKLAANWLVLEPGEEASHTYVRMQFWTCCLAARLSQQGATPSR